MSGHPLDKTPMQWIASLVDENSFLAFYPTHGESAELSYGSEVVTGIAKVQGRLVAIYAHNTSVGRGYVTSKGAQKICRLMDRAVELNIPIIAFLASPGIALEDGLESGDEYTRVISKNIALSGVIPQFAVILGPTLGAPAYSATLMDFALFNKHRSFLMVTSPTVVQQAIGEKVTMSDLGGSAMHAIVTGIADFIDDSIASQITQLKALLAFLPANGRENPPINSAKEPTASMPDIPSNPRLPFNCLGLIEAIVDDSTLIQYKRLFGQAMVCVFAHIQGYPVGIVANQSSRFSGAIDSDASIKTSRFISICDAYNIPLITLIDVPGFMPGKREEQKGLLRHGARLCAAMQTRVPRVSVVVRKCYGAAAFLMMQTQSQGGDLVLALDTARIGVMGKETTDKVKETDGITLDTSEKASSLSEAYALGMIDELIAPSEIRERLSDHLAYLYLKHDPLKSPMRPMAICP